MTNNIKHKWVQRFNLTVCEKCGNIKRTDGLNSPCRGNVKISMRNKDLKPCPKCGAPATTGPDGNDVSCKNDPQCAYGFYIYTRENWNALERPHRMELEK